VSDRIPWCCRLPTDQFHFVRRDEAIITGAVGRLLLVRILAHQHIQTIAPLPPALALTVSGELSETAINPNTFAVEEM